MIYPKDKINRIILILMIVIMLLPLFLLSFYAFPVVDDYNYSLRTHLAWTGNSGINRFIQVIISAKMEFVRFYLNHTGDYSATLMYLFMPSAFNEKFAFLNAWIMISGLIVLTAYMIKVFFKDYLKFSSTISLLITLCIFFLQTQFLPHKEQGFYWYNGGLYNVFGHAVFLGLFAIMWKVLFCNTKVTRKYYVTYFLLIFLWGGMSLQAILVFAITIILFGMIRLKKCNAEQIRFYKFAIVMAIIAAAIEFAAPGNYARLGSSTGGLTVTGTIIQALWQAKDLIWQFTCESFTVPILILLAPILWYNIKNDKVVVKYPLVYTVLSYGIYASTLCPTLLPLGNLGPGRTYNQFYLFYLFLIFSNYIYYIVWAKQKVREKEKSKENLLKIQIPLTTILIFASLMICARSVDIKQLTTINAIQLLVSGDARQYKKEQEERLSVLKNPEIKDAVLKELTVNSMLNYYDIKEDPTAWLNTVIAEYYGKETVRLETKED